MTHHYVIRSATARPVTMSVLEGASIGGVQGCVLNTRQLLDTLRDKGVTNVDIGRALELPSSRVAELFSGKRGLRYDEGVKLIEAFKLEGGHDSAALSVPVARLAALHMADALGADLDAEDPRVEVLALEIRALLKLANDPRWRESLEAAEGFFQGLKLAPHRTAGA